MTTALIGPTLKRPPGVRAPINIDPTVREELRSLLYEPYMRGVGYSEFILRAVKRAREEAEEQGADV